MLKQAYQDKLEAQLQEWDARLDLVKAKAKALGADAKIEYETQLAALQQKRHEAQAKLADLRSRSEVALTDLKEGTERAWSEMAKATESLVSRFK